MEEGFDKKVEFERNDREEIYAQSVRAGKRTYFFDVKATRSNDYYLTITESKKRFGKDGKSFYEKHKIFLYKEDFDKFLDALTNSIDFINENRPPVESLNEAKNEDSNLEESTVRGNYTDVDFEDLEEKRE